MIRACDVPALSALRGFPGRPSVCRWKPRGGSDFPGWIVPTKRFRTEGRPGGRHASRAAARSARSPAASSSQAQRKQSKHGVSTNRLHMLAINVVCVDSGTTMTNGWRISRGMLFVSFSPFVYGNQNFSKTMETGGALRPATVLQDRLLALPAECRALHRGVNLHGSLSSTDAGERIPIAPLFRSSATALLRLLSFPSCSHPLFSSSHSVDSVVRAALSPSWICGICRIFVPPAFMTKAQKSTDVSGTKPEKTATASAEASTHEASKRPLWSQKLNRVDCSIWEHDQNGESRFTIAISRSYFDRKLNAFKRSFYFDRQDLKDVREVCAKAEEYLVED